MAPPAQKSKEGSKNFQHSNTPLSVDKFRQAGERILQKVALTPRQSSSPQPTPRVPTGASIDRSLRQTSVVPSGVPTIQKPSFSHRPVRLPEKKRPTSSFVRPEKSLQPLSLKELSDHAIPSVVDSNKSYSHVPTRDSEGIDLDILKHSINDALKGLSSDHHHDSKQQDSSNQENTQTKA
jgi:hypothetical protein